jgi:hypothetical protein
MNDLPPWVRWCRRVAASDLTPGDRGLALALLEWADIDSGRLWPSVSRIAEATGRTHRYVQLAIPRLVAAGLLDLPEGRSPGGRGKTTVLRLLLDTPATETPVSGSGIALETPNGAPETPNGATRNPERGAGGTTQRTTQEPNPSFGPSIEDVIRASPPAMITSPRLAREAVARAVAAIASRDGSTPAEAAAWLRARVMAYRESTFGKPTTYSLHGWIRDECFDAPSLAGGGAAPVDVVRAEVGAFRARAEAIRRSAVPPPPLDTSTPLGRAVAARRLRSCKPNPARLRSSDEPENHS